MFKDFFVVDVLNVKIDIGSTRTIRLCLKGGELFKRAVLTWEYDQ